MSEVTHQQILTGKCLKKDRQKENVMKKELKSKDQKSSKRMMQIFRYHESEKKKKYSECVLLEDDNMSDKHSDTSTNTSSADSNDLRQ